MANKADFYIGCDPETMTWLGSLHRSGSIHGGDPVPNRVLSSPHINIILRERICNPETGFEYSLAVRQLVMLANVGTPVWDHQSGRTTWLETGENGYGTLPEDGWPWAWETSEGTDLAYAYFDNKVWCSCGGGAWTDVSTLKPEEWPSSDALPKAQFPVFPVKESLNDDDDEE